MRGLPTAVGSIGFLSCTVDGLQTVFRNLLDSSPWTHDAETIEMPWRQDKFDAVAARTQRSGRADGRLVFGLLKSDHYVQPHPIISKALAVVKQALEQCGHEVSITSVAAFNTLRVLIAKQIIDWQPPAQSEAVDNLVS